jgi:hypothetical protein
LLGRPDARRLYERELATIVKFSHDKVSQEHFHVHVHTHPSR